jgi:hypothetical protein
VEVCFTRAVSEYKLLDYQYNADKELKMVAVNTRLRECQQVSTFLENFAYSKNILWIEM